VNPAGDGRDKRKGEDGNSRPQGRTRDENGQRHGRDLKRERDPGELQVHAMLAVVVGHVIARAREQRNRRHDEQRGRQVILEARRRQRDAIAHVKGEADVVLTGDDDGEKRGHPGEPHLRWAHAEGRAPHMGRWKRTRRAPCP